MHTQGHKPMDLLEKMNIIYLIWIIQTDGAMYIRFVITLK